MVGKAISELVVPRLQRARFSWQRYPALAGWANLWRAYGAPRLSTVKGGCAEVELDMNRISANIEI
jgi:hypothetical protein